MEEHSFDEVSRFFNQSMGMNQEQVKEAKEKEFLNIKNKRRSKKDKTGRNYICGCGKEYLSYPALYTHIKTKHDGVQPVGTKAHITSNNKRGRPKKDHARVDDNRTIPDRDNAPFNLNFIHQPSQFKGDNFALLDGFVEKGDLRLIEVYNLEGKTDPTTGFLITSFYDGDKPTYHPFHVIINGLQSDTRSETILSNNSCDTVMALFLFSASKITSEKFYLILGIFFRNLRECLNERGYSLIEEYFIKNYSEEARTLIPKKKGEKIFCETESPEFLPLVSDKFILEYLPKYCPEFDQQLAVDIMYDFSKWLIKKKFTRIKVSFNDNDEIDSEEVDDSNFNYYDEIQVSKKFFGEIQ